MKSMGNHLQCWLRESKFLNLNTQDEMANM
jgi:hypothetical protein